MNQGESVVWETGPKILYAVQFSYAFLLFIPCAAVMHFLHNYFRTMMRKTCRNFNRSLLDLTKGFPLWTENFVFLGLESPSTCPIQYEATLEVDLEVAFDSKYSRQIADGRR